MWILLLLSHETFHVIDERVSFRKKYTFVVMFGTIWGSVHLSCHGDVSLDDLCLILNEMEHVVINLRRRHHT